MVGRRQWFERRFGSGLPPEAFPEILERLRGTPARLEERLRGLPPDLLRRRMDETWSVQENAGHLLDLERLWAGRLDDLMAGARELQPADLQNRKTHGAQHNERDLATILERFRRARERLVGRLEALGEAELGATALHPRLKQPMTVVDLCFFVAEHDDHHLARITEILRRR